MFFLGGLIVGAVLGAAYFFQRFDSGKPNETLAEAILIVVQFAAMVGTFELLTFLYRAQIRLSPLLKSRHKSLVLAVFVLFVISLGRLGVTFLVP